MTTSRKRTWFSSWQTHWRTSLTAKCTSGQSFGCWYSGVGCKFRFVKGIWPCPLASTLEKYAWTRHLRTHDLDDFEIIRRAIWRGHRIDRVEAENSTLQAACGKDVFWVLVSFVPCYSLPCGNGEWKLATLVLICRWYAASHWSTICRRHPAFARSAMKWGNVEQLGGRVVGGGSSVECW